MRTDDEARATRLDDSKFEDRSGECRISIVRRFFPWFHTQSPAIFCLLFLVIGVIGFLAVIYASRFGLATSADSARYIQWSRHMLGREASAGLEWTAGDQAHYPPVYPAMLAIISRGGIDPLAAARWFNAALLALNALLAGLLVVWATRSRAAGVFTAAAMIASPTCVFIHTWALSESLFVLWMLASLGALAMGIERSSWTGVMAAGFFSAAAALTRYAGIALVPVGLIAILWNFNSPWKKRGVQAALFSLCALLPSGGWGVRNWLVLGSATHRAVSLHPISARHLAEAFHTVGHWFGFVEAMPMTIMTWMVVIGALLWGARRAYQSRMQTRAMPLILILLIFIVSFSFLLIASISFFDFHTPLDVRILSPIYVAWLMVGGLELAAMSRWGKGWRIAGWCAAIVLLGGLASQSARTIHDLHRDGGGFAHRAWRESATMKALASAPANTMIYSNAPGAIYLVAGRKVVLPLPLPIDLSSREVNGSYAAQLQKVQNDLNGGGLVVYFNRYGGGGDSPRGRDWVERLKLKMIAHRSDGAIYEGANDWVRLSKMWQRAAVSG